MKREEAIKLVEAGFEQLEETLKQGKSDALMKYLATMSKFHRYSLRNLLMIWQQNENATMVAGFRAWQKLGRTVKKGEKGIAIFAPMPFKKKAEDGNGQKAKTSEPKSDEGAQMMGFRVVHVFDVSQTEGDPLPETAKVTGDIGDNLERLKNIVTNSGIELVFESIDGGACGYSAGGKIVIEESLNDEHAFQVLAHELAHERLHQGERKGQTTKKVRETEAEAVGFIVANAFDLDATSHCAEYIQLYDGNSDTLRESLKHIQSTAQWIVESIHSIASAEAENVPSKAEAA
jgi:antirestriction protein ArdC